MAIVEYEQILKGRDEYQRLIKSLGLEGSIHRDNRIFQAYKLLEHIIPIHKNSSDIASYQTKAKLNAGDLYSILSELAELYQIFSYIGKLEDTKALTTKIKDLSSGQLNPLQETTSNTLSRNTQFELRLAADLIKGGAKVKIEDINPDLRLSLQSGRYGVECKRITSLQQFKRNFKDARNQIRLSLEASKFDQGIIAISITNIMHDKSMAMRANDLMNSQQELLSHVNDAMFRLMDDFTAKYSHVWANDDRSQKMSIPAVLLHYRVVVLGGIHGLGPSELFRFIDPKGDESAFDKFLADFGKDFKSLVL